MKKFFVIFVVIFFFFKVKSTFYLSMELTKAKDYISKIYNENNITFYQGESNDYTNPIVSLIPYEIGEKIFFDLYVRGDEGYFSMNIFINGYIIKTDNSNFWKCTVGNYEIEKNIFYFYPNEVDVNQQSYTLFTFYFLIDASSGLNLEANEAQSKLYDFTEQNNFYINITNKEEEIDLINFNTTDIFYFINNKTLKTFFEELYFRIHFDKSSFEGEILGLGENQQYKPLNDHDFFHVSETEGLKYKKPEKEKNKNCKNLIIKIEAYKSVNEGPLTNIKEFNFFICLIENEFSDIISSDKKYDEYYTNDITHDTIPDTTDYNNNDSNEYNTNYITHDTIPDTTDYNNNDSDQYSEQVKKSSQEDEYSDNNFMECPDKCSNCTDESVKQNLCIQCNNIQGYYTITSKNDDNNGNSFLECIRIEQKPQGFYLNKELLRYEPCSAICLECSDYGNNCTKCNKGYIIIEDIPNNCVQNCTYYYYFNKYGYYTCTETKICPSGMFLIKNKRKCVYNCNNIDNTPYIYQFKDECFEKCPEGTKNNSDNICIYEEKDKCILSEEDTDWDKNELTDEKNQLLEKIVENYALAQQNNSNEIYNYKKENYNFVIYKQEECLDYFIEQDKLSTTN